MEKDSENKPMKKCSDYLKDFIIIFFVSFFDSYSVIASSFIAHCFYKTEQFVLFGFCVFGIAIYVFTVFFNIIARLKEQNLVRLSLRATSIAIITIVYIIFACTYANFIDIGIYFVVSLAAGIVAEIIDYFYSKDSENNSGYHSIN